MLDDRIKTWIREYNPSWDGKPEILPKFTRSLLETVAKFMGTKQILAVTGLRRVGKTVLMKQILEKTPVPKNALYFMFDDLLAQKPDVLEDIIDYFLNTIATNG